MNETAAEIATRLAKANPRGAIFRNSQGRAWTKDSINCAFRRLKKLTGIDGLCAYALAGGRTLAEVRDAARHANVSITSGYLHVAVDDEVVGKLFG